MKDGEKIRVFVTQEGFVKPDQQTLSPPEGIKASLPIISVLSTTPTIAPFLPVLTHFPSAPSVG